MSEVDELRKRLRDARREHGTELDPQTYARIVEHVVAFGPGQVRRSHQRRAAVRAALLVLPLVLLAGFWWRSAPQTQTQTILVRAACAERVLAETAARVRPDGSQLFELGEVGQIVLDPGSDAQLNAVDPCRLELQLVRGRASVHAANLFGGELKVRAGETEVVVHGTTFAVERAADEVLVDVETGAVAVASQGQPIAGLVRAGERMRVARKHGPVRSALGPAVRDGLRARFAPVPARAAPSEPAPAITPVVQELPPPSRERSIRPQPSAAVRTPAPDAALLVARADAAWAAGSLAEARASYRAAGQLTGATAEAAWLSLARNELALGRADAARAALAEHSQRFAHGKLAGEAAGIAFRSALKSKDELEIERSARHLVQHYPRTAQAAAAARWLRARETKH